MVEKDTTSRDDSGRKGPFSPAGHDNSGAEARPESRRKEASNAAFQRLAREEFGLAEHALASLHEQAHDSLPIRVCNEEPCRSLPERLKLRGPVSSDFVNSSTQGMLGE